MNEDLVSGKVVMKGKGLDGEKVCAKLRKAGKHCHIVPPPEPPKEEEKKDEKKEESKAQPNEPVSQFSQIHDE